MRWNPRLPMILFFAVALAAPGSAQSQSTPDVTSMAFKAGLDFSYLSRTITWDESGESSLLAYSLSFATEFEFRQAVKLTLIAGVSYSDLDDLYFRELPFSLRYKAGGVQGFVLGGELLTAPIALGGLEIRGQGRVVSSFGLEKTWAIEGLAVDGEAAGKPNWTEISAGPRFSYSGWESFSPYLTLSANWLSGKFIMTETIEDLVGREEKRIKGKGIVEIDAGADFSLSKKLVLRGEIRVIPQKKKADLGASLRLLYSF